MSTPVNQSFRLSYLDALRGCILLIMALGHTRGYWSNAGFDPMDLSQTHTALFLTRWLGHFCAPLFMFLAGISIYLYEKSVNNRVSLSRYLFTRGLWLILLEVSIVNFSSGREVLIWQVIGMTGLCMLLFAPLVWLPRPVLAILALVLIFGHNAFDTFTGVSWGPWNWVWHILHQRGLIHIGSFPLYLLYPLIPWIGVFIAGYLLGEYLSKPERIRDRVLLGTGIILLMIFVVLRYTNLYGNPEFWQMFPDDLLKTVLSFIALQKYPPSLLYLCLTIGIGCLVLLLLARYPRLQIQPLLVFGRVPLFFYLLHLPVIKLGWWLVNEVRVIPGFVPAEYSPQGNLLTIYIVWAITMLILYFPCCWYAQFKREHKSWQSLKYI